MKKLNLLFSDVETKGKIQGAERASIEFRKIYRDIENEFIETKKVIEQQKKSNDNNFDILISKLDSLTQEKILLEKQVKIKEIEVSNRFDIPVKEVNNSMSVCTSSLVSPVLIGGVLELAYKIKKNKLEKSEKIGYEESKKLYENKIEKLRKELDRLKENGNHDIKELISVITEIFKAIADEQMKIAQLRILL